MELSASGREWLIDKSALARLAHSPDAQLWATRIERGLVRITTLTLLEVGYSARSAAELRHGLASAPIAAMPVEYLTPSIEDRAVAVQTLLAQQAQHRGPSVPDLLIAAAAELAGLWVLHLDHDFELIAKFTSQPTETLQMN
ncbi:MAG: PIN domain-containing protein [Actinomycetota bacterium]|nr:PIN domain-containing protein [Actinomycetota bacterium]